MAFSEAVQWWEEWQLRVLVLTSLFLQYFLFIASSLRKRCIPEWFKFLTWFAYLASDAVAIYALATLFNRHKKEGWVSMHRSNANLEVMWAPILLLHLGGQDGITAFNIEDNELWRRHVLTAVSQITVAIYVFRKTWSGEKRLLQAAILIFVPGILKCLEKPWALKNASINSIVDTSDSWIDKIIREGTENEVDVKSLDEYISAAVKQVQEGNVEKPRDHKVKDKPYHLFVDLAYSYSDRLKNLKYMILKRGKSHSRVRSGLSKTFDRLYTKDQVYKGLNIQEMSCRSCCGNQLRSVVVYLTFAAIGLFHKSHREVYNGTDVKITYTLLCCTAALEYISCGVKPYFDCFLRIMGLPWPDRVAQYNLIGYLARNRKHRRLRKLAFLLVCKNYLDQLWCMKSCKSSNSITELVHDHVMDGWNNCITDTATYRNFNDNRGQRTLEREKCYGSLELSLHRPFDEIVILWHLATDFCFYQTETGKPSSDKEIRHCRVISNYMAYLLFVAPEMLMAGARSRLFREAYTNLKEMVEDSPSQDVEELAKEIIQVKGGKDSGSGSGLVHDAWVIASELIAIGKDGEEGQKKMWRVIQGVWVEILCFSASRCRGYMHAKSMGKGGEYLSYVWLLLSYMGMETLAERLQRTELHAQGDMGAARPTSTPLVTATGDNSA